MILLLLSFVLYLHLGSLFNCIASYHQSESVTTLACLALQRLSSARKSSFVATLMRLSPFLSLLIETPKCGIYTVWCFGLQKHLGVSGRVQTSGLISR